MNPKLLSREEFKRAVFERDGYECVLCSAPAADAHHVVERRLWPDGGYYIENGVSLCAVDHILAETTEIDCVEVREAAGIETILLPPCLDPEGGPYDKWGNVHTPSGKRLMGPLFHEESVQKIIAPYLHLFVRYQKYPRSFHLPWSPGATSDDKMLKDVQHFVGKEIVLTEKLDGECTSMYSDHVHARSIESDMSHPSRHWIRALHGQIAYEIPEGFCLVGENLYAQHSIRYENLVSYFNVFQVRDETNRVLSWDETVECSELLYLQHVPVLWRGIFNEKMLRARIVPPNEEGYVVRLADSFPLSEFSRSVAKWVRPNHVQTDSHWMHSRIIKNGLLGD